MKIKNIFTILSIITVLLIFQQNSNTPSPNYNNLQPRIASKIIRFHVIGNSNSEYDQTLKLHIKDTVVRGIKPILKDASDVESARQIILANLPYIDQLANKELAKQHSSYSAKTSLSTRFFPIKQYGDMTLPEGDYESVCIELGNAKGKNWWCVLYPSLCFIDSTYSILPSESKNKLKHTLTADEYNYIMQDNNTSITYQSAIYNFIQKTYTNIFK